MSIFASDTENISTTEMLITAMTNDPDLYARMLSLLPNRDKFEVLHGRYKENLNAYLGGDRQKGLMLEVDSKELNRELTRFITLVKLVAEDDPTLLQKLGINLQKGKKASKILLTAPANFSVRHGSEHGTMIAKASPVKGGKSYEIQVCEGDPSIESNWRHVATSAHCSRMEITGLTPGTVYWFRVKAVGARGFGPSSSYVSLMAI